jgi:LAO/AO transport system kinase
VGITGPPGAGKSTLISRIIDVFREKNRTVGVIAVDTSSPLTGGAVLGDRIRMQGHSGDRDGVFIRSMATRGHLGGLARATMDASYVMDAMGRDVIIIETVGVGQAEVEIAKTAQTIVIALTPGMGDIIQALKAGVLEIAHIFVINKADKAEVNDTIRDIQYMLSLNVEEKAWEPDIVKTVALDGSGVLELVESLERHKKYLEKRAVHSTDEVTND